MYQDKILVCKDCGKEFTFTRGEQEFYASKGFENEPTRCKECRARRKARTSNGRGKACKRVLCYNLRQLRQRGKSTF